MEHLPAFAAAGRSDSEEIIFGLHTDGSLQQVRPQHIGYFGVTRRVVGLARVFAVIGCDPQTSAPAVQVPYVKIEDRAGATAQKQCSDRGERHGVALLVEHAKAYGNEALRFFEAQLLLAPVGATDGLNLGERARAYIALAYGPAEPRLRQVQV